MSQSPVDSGNLTSVNSYRQGWKALNRLLHENKSFSGRETNNAFLNCGDGGRFADVSTAIGWDFADDARAIGLIDWDQDGDLDIWVSNRTAPRVRLLKNNLKSDSSFLSLHLTGDGKKTNRDAIGARVEVFLEGTKIPLIRTRQAGQSFLSQSSRWLHIGLGKSRNIEKVVVHWPGGEPESFTGIQANQFFHLVQGTGEGIWRKKYTPTNLAAGEVTLPPKTSIARIIPPAGHAIPPLKTQNQTFIEPTKTSLITLWSRTCPHCQSELKSWSGEKDEWKQSDVEVILFSTDQESRESCDDYLKSIGADFTAEMASPEAVEILDALQASFVDIWLPIPIPSSFLVSADGEVLAVYRGPVTREQVLKDSSLVSASPAERRQAATPFDGRWVGEPISATPQRAARQLVQRARPDLAAQYLEAALAKPYVKGSELDQGDNYLLLGQLHGQQGNPEKAIAPLRKAYGLIPHDVRVLRLLITAYRETGNYEDAKALLQDALKKHPKNADFLQDATLLESQFEHHQAALDYSRKAVELTPGDPSIRFQMIQLLLLNHEPAEAIENCKTILRTQPRYLAAANQLSRILSTHPDDKIRAGEEALALASRLCQITKNREGGHLVALALAQANLGKYKEATELLSQIQKSVRPESALGKEIALALSFTTRGKPVRNSKWGSGSDE